MSYALSVVVATHNKAQHLARNLRSLAWQTLEPERYEVIVVDDGSTDETVAVVEEAQKAAPSLTLRYVYLPRPWTTSSSLTWNVGAKVARSPIMVYAGADIILAKDALALLKYYQEESDGDQFTFAQCYRSHSLLANTLLDHVPIDQHIHAVQEIFVQPFHHAAYWHVPLLAALPVRWFHELGGHDESYPDTWPDDEDWWVRLQASGVYGLNALDCWGIHQYHPQADAPCGPQCPCPLSRTSRTWPGPDCRYQGTPEDLVRNRAGWGQIPEAPRPRGRVHQFRFLRPDEPFLDQQWVPGHWSRPYEWGYVLRVLRHLDRPWVHHTGCGDDDYTRTFARAVAAEAGLLVNSDVREPTGFDHGVRYDLRQPYPERDWCDVVLCISTLEEVGVPDVYAAWTALDHLWAQVKPGGRLIVTVDIGSGFKTSWLESWVHQRCGQEGPHLTGGNSVVPQPHRAHLRVLLLDLEKPA